MLHAKYVHKYNYDKTGNWTETNQNGTLTINDNNQYTVIDHNGELHRLPTTIVLTSAFGTFVYKHLTLR